jgi:MFS family permease
MLSTKGVSPTVITLGWVSLLTDISSEMVAAVLPLFVVLQLGLSPLTYGFVEGIYQAGSVFARILGGYLGDLRKPKIVAAAGYASSAACKILLMIVTSLTGIMAVIALDRAGKGLRTAPRDAMIADATPGHLMGRAFGVHRALDTVGALLGPIVAWLLLMIVADDFKLVFFVSFCFAVLGVLLIGGLKPEHADGRPGATGEAAAAPIRFAEIGAAVGTVSMRGLILMTALLSVSTIADGFLYLSLSMQGAVQTVQFPLLFVGTSFVYILMAVPVGNLADRIGRPLVFIAGYVFLLVAYLGAGPIGGLPGTVICVVALGLYYSATDGVLSAFAAPLLPDRLRSTGLSVVQAVQATGKAVGAVIFGLVWSYYGLQAAIGLFVTMLLLAMAAGAVLTSRLADRR